MTEPERIARESLKKAYTNFPMGCSDREMKKFLSKEPYPELSFAIMWKDDYSEELKKAHDKKN